MSGAVERSDDLSSSNDLWAGAGQTAPLNGNRFFESRPHRRVMAARKTFREGGE